MSILETAASTPMITPIIEELLETALATVTDTESIIEEEELIPPPELFDDGQLLERSTTSPSAYTYESLASEATQRSSVLSSASGQLIVPVVEITPATPPLAGEEDYFTPTGSSTHLLSIVTEPHSLVASSKRSSVTLSVSKGSEQVSGTMSFKMSTAPSPASKSFESTWSETRDPAKNASGIWYSPSLESSKPTRSIGSATDAISDIAQNVSDTWSTKLSPVVSEISEAETSFASVPVETITSDIAKHASDTWSEVVSVSPKASITGESIKSPSAASKVSAIPPWTIPGTSDVISSIGSRGRDQIASERHSRKLRVPSLLSTKIEGGEIASIVSRTSSRSERYARSIRSPRKGSDVSAVAKSADGRTIRSGGSARARSSRTSGIIYSEKLDEAFSAGSPASIMAGSIYAGSFEAHDEADTFVDVLPAIRITSPTPTSSRSRTSAYSSRKSVAASPSVARGAPPPRSCDCEMCKCNPCKDASVVARTVPKERPAPTEHPAPNERAGPMERARRLPFVCRCTVCRCPNCPGRGQTDVRASVLQSTLNEGFTSDDTDVKPQQPASESEPAISKQPPDISEPTEQPAALPAKSTERKEPCEVPCECSPCVCEPCPDLAKFKPIASSTKYGEESIEEPTDNTISYTFNPPSQYGSSSPSPEEESDEEAEAKLFAMMKEVEPCPMAPCEGAPADEDEGVPVVVTPPDGTFVKESAPAPAEEAPITEQRGPSVTFSVSPPESGEDELLGKMKEVLPCPPEEDQAATQDLPPKTPPSSITASAPPSIAASGQPSQVQQTVSVGGRPVDITYPTPRGEGEFTQLTLDKVPTDHPLKCQCPVCKCSPCNDPSIVPPAKVTPSVVADMPPSPPPPPPPTAPAPATTEQGEPTPDDDKLGGEMVDSWEFEPKASSTKVKDAVPPGSTEIRLPPELLGPWELRKTEPAPDSIPAPKTTPLMEDKLRALDTDTLERRLASLETESARMSTELTRVRSLMERMQCACERQLRQVQERQPLVDPAPSRSYRATMDGLGSAHAYLEARCREKDRLISAVTDELRVRAESGVFEQLLGNVASRPPPTIDYDRTAVSNALPRPPVQRTPAEKPGETRFCSCHPPTASDPSPLAVTEIRRVEPDALLVKWSPPAQAQCFSGYEVEVDGMLRTRVRSVDRTAAVLHGIDPEVAASHVVTVHAILKNGGRAPPPASAVYEPRQSSSSRQDPQKKCGCV